MFQKIKFLLTILCALLFFNTYAQQPKVFHPINAWYGSTTEGIALFEVGHYFLYGYATLVHGTYVMNGNDVQFLPTTPGGDFEVYGAINKKTEKGTRFYFSNFEEAETYFHLHSDTMFPVMNPTFNCISGPFVWKSEGKVENIFLGLNDGEMKYYQIENTRGFNDFMLFYNPKTRYSQPFQGAIKSKGNNSELQFQLVDESIFTFKKRMINEQSEDWMWLKAMNIKFKENTANDSIMFATEDYNILDAARTTGYVFDVAKGLYVEPSLYAIKDWEKMTPKDYLDLYILRKYQKLPMPIEIDYTKKPVVATTSIFYSDCDDPDNSYHYAAAEEGNEVSTNVNPQDDDFSFKPYVIDRDQDGIYEVQNDDGDYGHGIIADTPVLASIYFVKAEAQINEMYSGQVSVVFTLSVQGQKLFAYITSRNINKQLAIIISGEVVMQPRVMSEINSSTLMITGGLTEASANAIASKINNRKRK